MYQQALLKGAGSLMGIAYQLGLRMPDDVGVTVRWDSRDSSSAASTTRTGHRAHRRADVESQNVKLSKENQRQSLHGELPKEYPISWNHVLSYPLFGRSLP